ncbi:MAG: 3-phosphoshikimate 1-carboxyvinyltransferase [Desulfovibrio sp.]|nr:3-phosphoshikimate 1-carboxyvinyltransferase [Desulfovibrio sp.]MCA1987007.1 3-phosphoshikimate 1-carboxyvinyltransferase [Desulfovibrio sp.]
MTTSPPAAVVTAPASKSVSHRACLCGALAGGVSTIRNVLESEDLARTAAVLTAMGARITRQGPGAYAVTGLDGHPTGGDALPADLDVGESGTTCRLVTAIAAAGQGRFRLHGRGRMHDRPIGPLARALESQGAVFHWEGTVGNPPCLIEARGLAGGQVDIDLEESSQYLSGLLLAAPMAREASRIHIIGKKAVSWPYISLTLQAMQDFGVEVTVQELQGEAWTTVDWQTLTQIVPGRFRFLVSPGRYQSRDYVVEGDWSNASYFLAAGVLGSPSMGPVAVQGLRQDSFQGDRAMLRCLEAMGAAPRWEGRTVMLDPTPLHGAELDMGTCPDIVPTVAVTAAFASSPTIIRNVAHLRIKECDRLDAVATELRRIGTQVEILDDGLRIVPQPVPEAVLRQGVDCLTYNDHRLAMCLSLFERRGITVRLDTPQVVSKSFPAFWDTWNVLRAQHGRRDPHGVSA